VFVPAKGEPRSTALTLTVDVSLGILQKRLTEAAQVYGNPRAPLRMVGQMIVDDMARPAFRNQESPDGVPWPKIAPSTLARRQREGRRQTKALLITGELRNSFTYRIEEGGNVLVVGSPRRDAVYHQGDDTRPRTLIPERAMLPKPKAGFFQPHVFERILTTLQDGMLELALKKMAP